MVVLPKFFLLPLGQKEGKLLGGKQWHKFRDIGSSWKQSEININFLA